MLKLLVLAGLLASCTAKAPPPPANVGAPAPSSSSALPAGWMTIVPSEERLHCANYAQDEWQVSIDGSAVRVVEAKNHEPNSGPELPFTLPPQQQDFRGRRHVLAMSDGFVVGFDAGEWGGALYWFSADGKQQKKLAGENVRGLVAFGDAIGSIEGLAHMGFDEGRVRWLDRSGGALHEVGVTDLKATPETFVATGDRIYLLTTGGLRRIARDHRLTEIQPVKTDGLYPDSMTIDPSGALWVGMRQLVLRLTPVGDQFAETWLVRETCRDAEVHNLDCVCKR